MSEAAELGGVQRPPAIKGMRRPRSERRRVGEAAELAGAGVPGDQAMERATGIEPVSEAWEASVLPLYEARARDRIAKKA